MTESENVPQFVTPKKAPPMTPADRVRAGIVLTISVLIAILGWLAFWQTSNLATGQSELLCFEEYAGYGFTTAFDSAVWWTGASVWAAFGALALATYSQSRAWLYAALVSAGLLALFGAAAALIWGMSYFCQ